MKTVNHSSILHAYRNIIEASIEKSPDDQVFAGNYRSKNFEMSDDARRIYSDISKESDPDKVERSVKLHDQLFAITKRVRASGYSTKEDIDQSKNIVDRINNILKDMNLPSHDHLNTALKEINDKYEEKSNVVDSITPEEIKKRFTSTPKSDTEEAQKTPDSVKNHHVTRSTALKRKRFINTGVDESMKNTAFDGFKSLSEKVIEAAKKIIAEEVIDEANNPFASQLRSEKNPKKRKELIAKAKEWADTQARNKAKPKVVQKAVTAKKSTEEEPENIGASILKGKLAHMEVPELAKIIRTAIVTTDVRKRPQKMNDIYHAKTKDELIKHLR